jgi:hypothetical protein
LNPAGPLFGPGSACLNQAYAHFMPRRTAFLHSARPLIRLAKSLHPTPPCPKHGEACGFALKLSPQVGQTSIIVHPLDTVLRAQLRQGLLSRLGLLLSAEKRLGHGQTLCFFDRDRGQVVL